jgi:PmbA protein
MKSSLDTISWLLREAKAQGADNADSVLFETVDMNVSQRLGKPEGLERSESKAIGIRAFVGEKQAIASSTDLSQEALKELASRAVSMARMAPPDPDGKLAPAKLHATASHNLDLFDAAEPDVDWMRSQCGAAEEAALAVKGITNSEGADCSYGQSHVSLGILENGKETFSNRYTSSYFFISVSVLAGAETSMERDYDFSSTHHRADLQNPSTIGKTAGELAIKKLAPRKVKSCQVPVVFDPRVSKSLLGIFASSINGASVARGSSFLKDDKGKLVFSPSVNITDDPHIVRGLGSKPFDGEGVANKKCSLVENGVLMNWLLDMRTASKLGLATTGHAARGIASPPSPSSTNLYMHAGNVSVPELISDIKNGFYVTETFGMGVNTTTGDYSQGASGFWIENGEIVYPVSEITIAGGLRDMFAHITPANDLRFRYSTNAPTLRVEAMTIAGL